LCENVRIGLFNDLLAVVHAAVWLEGLDHREVYVKPPFFVRIAGFEICVSAIESQEKLYAITSLDGRAQNVLLKNRVWFGRGAEIIPEGFSGVKHISRKHFSMELAYLGSQMTPFVLVTNFSKNGSLVFPADEEYPMVIPGVRFKFYPRIEDKVEGNPQLQQTPWTCERKDSSELLDRTRSMDGELVKTD